MLRSSVFPSYIWAAAKLSPEKRLAIIEGNDTTSFTLLLDPPPPALPAPKAVEDSDLFDLFDVVRRAGVNRVLDVAAAVEAAE